MNDYMMYELAKQRHADVIDELQHARPVRLHKDGPSASDNATISIRRRPSALARALTERPAVPRP